MTAVTTVSQERAPNKIVTLFRDHEKELKTLLPAGVELSAIRTEFFFAAQRNPRILECTPDSILRALATVCQRGLTVGETIHLVPMTEKFKDENDRWRYREVLNAWNDYKGDIELVVRAGAARAVTAHPVFENDQFRQWSDEKGDHAELIPTPLNKPRGKLIGAFAVGHVRQTLSIVKVLRLEEIEAVRAKSKSWAPSGDKNVECPTWYAIKTAVHALCKMLPKTPRLAALLRTMDVELVGEPEEIPDPTALPAADPVRAIAGEVPGDESPAPTDAFEEESDLPAIVCVPNWRNHPLAGKPLTEIATDDLGALYSKLMESKPDHEFVPYLAAELDSRRPAA